MEDKVVGVDTETKGLGGRLHRLGVLTSENDWYWLSEDEAKYSAGWKREVLDADHVVLHNAKYDYKILKRDVDFKLPEVDDTLVMAAMILPARQAKDLLTLSMKFLDYNGQKDLEVEKQKEEYGVESEYDLLDDETLEAYTQQQLINTLSLFIKWRRRMPDAYWDFECYLPIVLAEMEERGVRCDKEVLKNSEKDILKKIEEIKEETYELADGFSVEVSHGLFGADFNLNSHKQIGEILKERGFDLPRTKSGQVSTSESNLKKYCGGDEFVENLLDLREYEKLESTYIEGLIDDIDEDGSIRPSFSTTITRTGRISSSNPNLQNISDRKKTSKYVREAFRSRRFYDVFCFDFSQIELRLAGFLTDDSKLIEEYEEGIDFHKATAARILDKKPGDITYEERQIGKTYNFARQYGAGAEKVSGMLEVSEAKAEEMINRYRNHYRTLSRYKKRLTNRVRRVEYLQLPYGRKLKIDSQYAYKAFSYLVQGTAADIIKRAMVDVHRFLDGMRSNMVLQIHDELVIEEHITEDIRDDIRRIMEDASDLCPLDVDVEKWDDNWSNKKSVAPF